jgi:hypothetical protein
VETRRLRRQGARYGLGRLLYSGRNCRAAGIHRLAALGCDRNFPLVGSEDIDRWKDYLRFHLIEHYASVLPKAVPAEDFTFYGTILTGTRQAPERSKAAIAATNGALGQALGQLYTQRYFPPEAKARAQGMVDDLITAYRARISNLAWMSPQTKEKALAKLAAPRIGIGYPDSWMDYSMLDVVPGDAFGNMGRAEAFNRSYNLAKLKRPADADGWRIDPQIIGAVIVFTPNTETFSAGILQPPYFDYQGDARPITAPPAPASPTKSATPSMNWAIFTMLRAASACGGLRQTWPNTTRRWRSWLRNLIAIARFPIFASMARRS